MLFQSHRAGMMSRLRGMFAPSNFTSKDQATKLASPWIVWVTTPMARIQGAGFKNIGLVTQQKKDQ